MTVARETRECEPAVTGEALLVGAVITSKVIDRVDRRGADIGRDPDNGYVAAIGDDIHSYQRYPLPRHG
jgi:hypothetical protein